MTSFQKAAADFIRSELVGTTIHEMTTDDATGFGRVQLGRRREITDEDRIEVTDFDFRYDEGYRYSSWTYEDTHFSVVVTFKLNDETTPRQHTLYDEDTTSMGTFLTGLLAHEDAA